MTSFPSRDVPASSFRGWAEHERVPSAHSQTGSASHLRTPSKSRHHGYNHGHGAADGVAGSSRGRDASSGTAAYDASPSKSTDVPPYPFSSEYGETVPEMPAYNAPPQRKRVESLSSIGSSVAPAAPAYRLNRRAGQQSSSSRHDRYVDDRSAQPQQQQPVSALEAWIRQATDASVPRKSSLLFNNGDDARHMQRDPSGSHSHSQAQARRRAPSAAPELDSTLLGLSGADFGGGRAARSGRRYDERQREREREGSTGGWSNGVLSNGVMSGSGRRRIVKPKTSLLDTAHALDLSSAPLSPGLAGVGASGPGPGSASATRLDHVQRWRAQSLAADAPSPTLPAPGGDTLQVPSGAGASEARLTAYPPSSVGSRSRSRSSRPHRPQHGHGHGHGHAGSGPLGELPGIEERSALSLSESSALRSIVRWMAKNGLKEWSIPSGLLFVLFVKWCTGLGGWSGRGVPPLYGDFEAQRHWLELTLHVPHSKWYHYSPDWWQLDYPPLTAWVSLLCAKVGTLVPGLAPDLALDSSRGAESPLIAVFMRATVIVLDLLVYVPAVLFFLHKRLAGRGLRTKGIAAISILLQPGLILIDNGHFQYNSVMLGFCALCFALLYSFLPTSSVRKAAVAGSGAAAKDGTGAQHARSLTRSISYQYIIAAVAFSCALGFKQMSLYFAPAIFAVMLGRCWGLKRIEFDKGFALFAGLGAAVLGTFFLMLLPWLASLSQLQQILVRVFPLARGLFEDKVANLWCFLTVLPVPQRYKLRNMMEISSLARLSLLTTLLAILPTCAHLFWAGMETVNIEVSIDAEAKARATGSIAGSTRGDPSVAGLSVAADERRTRKPSVAGSDAGTDRMTIFSGRTAGGTAVRRPVLANQVDQRPTAVVVPSPAAAILPYALLSVSMAFFLFGFQVHEKSILIPLLPLTLIMSSKGDAYSGGAGATDWEWAVLANNVATFSMWPLLKRDGIAVQYICINAIWNWAIGNQPFAQLQSARKTFIGWFSAGITAAIVALHLAEIILPACMPASVWGRVAARYPDLFPVLNVLLCGPTFGLVWLWSLKRQLEVGYAAGLDSLSLLQAVLRIGKRKETPKPEGAQKTQ